LYRLCDQQHKPKRDGKIKSNQQTLSQKRSRVSAVSNQEINKKNRKNLSHLYNFRYDYYEYKVIFT